MTQLPEPLTRALVILAAQEAVRQQAYRGLDLHCREWADDEFPAISEQIIRQNIELQPDVGDIHYGLNQWIFLPAPHDGPLRIPIINFLRDYPKSHFSFQMGVFYPDPAGKLENPPLGRAWRFEAPEGPDSIHGFFHAQPGHALRTLQAGDVPMRSADTEIPQGQPTFPLDAADEVDLLVCLLLSVYGLKEGEELIDQIGEPALRRSSMGSVASIRRRSRGEKAAATEQVTQARPCFDDRVRCE